MDKLLDLTDNDICNKIGETWEKYQKGNGLTDVKDNELGLKLNLLFKSIKIFQENFYVIKIYGRYNKTPKNKLWSYNVKGDKAEPISTVKCIYNVKNEEAIGERKTVERC